MDDKKRRDNLEEDVILESEETPESKSSKGTSFAEAADSGQASMTDGSNVQQDFEQIKALASQLDNQLKRSLADYQNLQRRTQEEKSEWIRSANKDLVLKFLPILDTLMLAEKHTKDQNFALLVGQFLQVLKDEGIERIKTLGETFDPLIMEAVSTKEGKAGKVVEELRAGYMFGDTVLRAAQVIVGK